MDVLLYNSFDVQGHLFRVYFVGKLIILRKDLVRYLFFKKLVKWCYENTVTFTIHPHHELILSHL